MQQYLVKISFEAKDQIRNILEYLFFVFKSKQAYDAVKKIFLKRSIVYLILQELYRKVIMKS